MSQPLVSICLPVLNARQFIAERLQSILEQSYQNFEIIVVDSYSKDGTWEYLQEEIGSRPNTQLVQFPPGLYAGWNHSISLCKGEFVYIAPADDLMTPDCLEKLVAGLQEHPECDIAHSNLTVIDETGTEIPNFYKENCQTAKYFKDLIDQPHIRYAPHDGLLHYYGSSVYVSMTQLLIRRSLFSKAGNFRTDFGPTADFEWAMRASLQANTIHIPEYLSKWRLHQAQVTSFSAIDSLSSKLRHIQMTRAAVSTAKESKIKIPVHFFNQNAWELPFKIQGFAKELEPLSAQQKLELLLKWIFEHPFAIIAYLQGKITRQRFDSFRYIRKRIERAIPGSVVPKGETPEQ